MPLSPSQRLTDVARASSVRDDRLEFVALKVFPAAFASDPLEKSLPDDDKTRMDEHLSSIRDLERAIAGLPPGERTGRSAKW